MAKKKLALAVLLGLSLVSACAPLPGAPLPGAPPMPPLRVSATTGKSTYLPGEDVQITLYFTNIISQPLEIAPFPPLVEILKPGPHQLRQLVRSFAAGTGSVSLGPWYVASYTVTWDQRDDMDQQVPYGYYNIQLGESGIEFPDYPNWYADWRLHWIASNSLEVPPPILILPAEGAMEKTIDVNMAQTVNGLTVTLERVELSTTGMNVYASSTPPELGYDKVMLAYSQWSIDGGAVIDARAPRGRFDINRIEYIWMNLDPVPKSARELTFRITRLGWALEPHWDGPWEFLISLR